MAQPIKIKAGDRYNKLVAIEYAGTNDRPWGKLQLWKFQCDCGNQVIRTVSEVSRGTIKSCGCLLGSRSNAKRNVNGSFLPGPREPVSLEIWKDKYADGCPYDTFLILSQEPCHYCGTILSCTRKDRYSQESFSYNGLDRLDSLGDHSPTNVVTCCWPCNQAKMGRTYQEFIDWIHRAHNHLTNRFVREWVSPE